jgi:putative transposase
MSNFEIDPKRIRHFNVPGHAHLLTFSCFNQLPLLLNDARRTLLSRCIDRANEHHQFQLIAFVYMPEHIHLLVYPKDPVGLIEKLLYAIKKPFSDRIKKELIAKESPQLRELTIRERPGKRVFRFWQEGPGHDRNLLSVESVVKAAEYLHNNPVRRRLCAFPDQWRWSSWRYYFKPASAKDAALPNIHGFPS